MSRFSETGVPIPVSEYLAFLRVFCTTESHLTLHQARHRHPARGPVDARRMAVDMLRRGREAFASDRGLQRHEMSGRTAFFFPAGLLPDDWGAFADPGGKTRRRRMTGVRGAQRVRWHFALSAKPQILPVRRLVLRSHVVFSEASGRVVARPPPGRGRVPRGGRRGLRPSFPGGADQGRPADP